MWKVCIDFNLLNIANVRVKIRGTISDIRVTFSVITARHIGDLVDLMESQTINLNTAKVVLAELITNPEQTPMEVREQIKNTN